MTITAEQREARRHHVGSSDIPALLGIDAFGKTATDIYWSKVAEVPDTSNAQKVVGNSIETVLVDFAAQRLGLTFTRDVTLTHERGILAANCDAIHDESGNALECKVDAITAEDWGTEGTDEIPLRVVAQAQAQIACGAAGVWVPALIVGWSARFGLYRVEPHRELIATIEEVAERFWHDHVIPMAPPDGDLIPPIEVLKSLRRDRVPIRLDESALPIVAAFTEANEARKAAEKVEERAKREVLALLGEADEALLPDGRRLTYFQQKSAPSVDVTVLRAKYTEAAEECVRQGTHRNLLVRKK